MPCLGNLKAKFFLLLKLYLNIFVFSFSAVKSIEMDGLLWGASKLVPVGYGINKLQVMCVVEDEKVSIDLLQEKITDFEDFVQSCDVAAMNKI